MNNTQKNLIDLVASEAANDPEFRAAILAALGEMPAQAPARKRATRVAAPIDPIRSYLNGSLAGDLEGLEADELHAVIRDYHLDSARMTAKWTADRLRPYIMERAKARASQGNVFLNFQG